MRRWDVRKLLGAGLLVAMLACGAPQSDTTVESTTPAQTAAPVETTTPVVEGTHTVMVPMPDGARLATTVHLPRDGAGPWPALLYRTPYGRTMFSGFGDILAGDGIVGVLQDERGRYDSEGDEVGFFADTGDGQATLDWIITQPWSNGRIVTEGGSAQGIAQYLLAPGASDALVCQWIESATPDLYSHAFYQGGVFREALAGEWLTEHGMQHLIAEYMAHPLDGPYWDPVDTTGSFGEVHVAAVHVGSYHDIFARGTVEGFNGYQNEGGEGAAGNQHLVLGPWVHANEEDDSRIVGELTYPAAGQIELYDEWLGIWFEACAHGTVDTAELDALPTVSYFTMGAVGEEDAPGNYWHSADSWPPAGFTETMLYLRRDNTLALDPPERAEDGDQFVFDPSDPSPTICGANLMIEAGSCDQRAVEERADAVVYTSDVLSVPVEVTGDLLAEIWISTDVPDTDIAVRLTDVYPDGRSMLVADGILRARYHDDPDFTDYELLESGTPYLLSVDLGPTSIVFNAGHRIRMSVTSSNWPRFSVNPNTGAMFAEAGESGQVAMTTVLHDAEHPSAMVFPMSESPIG